MNKNKKKVAKKERLSDKLVKILKTQKNVVTYGKLAERMGTNARAVGQAVRRVATIDAALAKKVTYSTTTRPKSYAK